MKEEEAQARWVNERLQSHREAVRVEATKRNKTWVDRRDKKRKNFLFATYLTAGWAGGETL